MLGLIAVRFIYSSITGFLVPDEFWYYNNFILAGQQIPRGYREVFLAFYLLFFRNVPDVPNYLLRGAVYCTIWGAGSVLVIYKTIRLMKLPEPTTALLTLSLPLIPVFTVFVPLIITETMGLFFALLGVYFIVRFVNLGGAVNAFASALFFIMAYKVRQPYLLLAVGCVLAVVLSSNRSFRSFIAYTVPAAVVFPVPVSFNPLRLAQPIYAYFENWLATPWTALTRSTTATSTTYAYIPPPPPPISSGLLSGTSTVPVSASSLDLLHGFFIGLFYGYNPLFMLFICASVVLLAYTFRAA